MRKRGKHSRRNKGDKGRKRNLMNSRNKDDRGKKS